MHQHVIIGVHILLLGVHINYLLNRNMKHIICRNYIYSTCIYAVHCAGEDMCGWVWVVGTCSGVLDSNNVFKYYIDNDIKCEHVVLCIWSINIQLKII